MIRGIFSPGAGFVLTVFNGHLAGLSPVFDRRYFADLLSNILLAYKRQTNHVSVFPRGVALAVFTKASAT